MVGIIENMQKGIKGVSAPEAPTVDGEVNRITNQNSLAMRSAAQKGATQAASRGLGNSTLGAEASQRAMLDAALPMAQQNSSQAHDAIQRDKQLSWQSGENALNREHDLTLQNDAQGFQAEESKLNRTHDMSMQNDAQRYQSEESQLNRSHDMSMQNDAQRYQSEESQLNRSHDMSMQNDAQGFQSEESRLTRDHDVKMQNDGVRANTVGEYIKLVGDMSTGFMDAYKDIQASEIPADQKTKAINDLVKKRDEQLSSIKDMFSGLKTTEQDWSSFPDLI